MRIPPEINQWDKSQTVDYYIDNLKWTLVPLKQGTKEHLYNEAKAMRLKPEELRKDLGNGSNIGFYPGDDEVAIDLDSKADQGESVRRFLAAAGPRVQNVPRERTQGGVHLHLRIRDLPEFPGVRKLVNDKVTCKVSGEMFLHSQSYIVISPSVHESGHIYSWEVFGDIPIWSWGEFTSEFGEFLPEKEATKSKRGRKTDEEKRTRKWKGDLRSLDLEALLKEAGLFKEVDSKDPAKFVIRCPFEAEHSKTEDKGTAAWSPHDEKWPAFNCFHTHCSGRKTLDFLEQIEKDQPGIVDKHCAEKWTYEKGSSDRHGRVKVNLPQEGEQEKGEFVADVVKALADKEFWFTSNKRVTRIDKTIEIWTNAEGVEVEGRERLTIFPVSPSEAESTLGTHVCTGTTYWTEEEGRKIKQFVRHSMDNTTAKMLLSAPGLIDSLPRIDRVLDVTVPIAVGGGKWAMPKRGYNPELRLLLDADLKLREMPLDEALAMLNDIVRDFPFADDQSRTHWWARLVTPMCRGIMGFGAKVPLWMFLGNRMRAGKDYLNGVAQTLYYGNCYEDPAIPKGDSEETRKRITTALSAGRRSIHVANQQDYLEDAAFIAAITSPVVYDRRLGSNDASAQLEFRNELEFSMSGNVGLQWREDLTPRMRVIGLSYYEEDANSRKFHYPDLHGYVKENRESLLSAVYTMVLNWKKQGCPAGGTYTSFPIWARVVGGVLQAAGYEKFGERWVGMASVAALVTNTDGKNNGVSDFWNGMETVKDRKDFGRDLNTYKGRWLNGARMLVDSPSKRICRARIMFTKDASSDPGGERADSFTNKTNRDSVHKTRLSDLQDRGATSPGPDNVVNLVKVVTFSDRKSSDDENKNFQKQNETLSREFSTPKRNHFNQVNHITDLDGLTEALTHLENAAEDSPLYLDIETTGLDPRKSTIRLLTFSAGDGKVFIIDLDRVYFPDRLRALLESRTIVGQNLLFDSAFLKHHFKVNITKTWDTMIAGRLLSAGVLEETEGKDKDGNPSTILRPLGNDLSSLLKRYCGIELGEDLSKSDWSQPELTDAQLKYAAEDVAFLPQLKKVLEEAIEKEGMTGALELDNDCHPAMRDLNLTGMHVDRAKLEGMYHIAKRTLEDAREEVMQLLGNGYPKWNPDSNSDLREGLARKGISVTATNKEALSPFDRSKEVLALRRYRRAKSADVEKMKSLLDAIDDDSRIRTTYNPVGAITGRMSASDPNIQQTPKTDKSNIRYAFTAPPGKKLIKCDWNAMELRAAASYVNEESLLALFAAGRDAHRHTAASIYNKTEEEISKPERGIAKTANFNLVYGGSAKNLLSIINDGGEVIDLEEAEHIRRTFFRLYPVFRDWHSQTWDEAKLGDLQEVRTALGHRRKFHPSLETWRIVFAALNFPIQSACAEVLKFVLQDLNKQLPAGAQIVALLHDEIVLEADEADAQAVMDLTLKTMEEVGSVVFSKVHMKAEGSIRDSWG